MKVKDLMTGDVKCCADRDTLNTAAQIMWDYDIGCLPIVNGEGRCVGMLTDRDVCMSAYIKGVPLSGASVSSAMSREVHSCEPDDEIVAAEKSMKENQIRRLPVLDLAARPIGMISLNDIVREAARETETRAKREVTDAEIAAVLASVCAPRHGITQALAA